MHESHIDNLLTLRANLGYAIRNGSTATIGGGEFGPSELLSLKLAVDGMLFQHRDHGSEHMRNRLKSILG